MLLGVALLSLSAPLQASYGFADITPVEPMPLGGYSARQDKPMEGVADRLAARVLRLKQGDVQLALISVEMLTVPQSLTRAVVERAQRRGHDYPILLAATHTHCAPDSQMLNDRMRARLPGVAVYDPLRLQWYADKIVEALDNAEPLDQVENMMIAQGRDSLSRGRLRRAIPDPTVSRVIVELNSRPPIEILHFAAHPTLYGADMNFTSGDWPGYWMGWNTRRMFFNGAMGDISPAPPGDIGGDDGIEQMVARLNRAATNAAVLNSAELRVLIEPVDLPAIRIHPEFATRHGVPNFVADSLARRFAATEASVIIVRYGELALIGIPGEPSSVVGRRLTEHAREHGISYPVVVSFANDWLGYILSPAQYDAGGYEATLSFHGQFLASRIEDAVARALGK